jgi:hypothetical protein
LWFPVLTAVATMSAIFREDLATLVAPKVEKADAAATSTAMARIRKENILNIFLGGRKSFQIMFFPRLNSECLW